MPYLTRPGQPRLYYEIDDYTGAECRGPAIVQEYDTTVVVPPGWTAALDNHGNILLERSAGASPAERP